MPRLAMFALCLASSHQTAREKCTYRVYVRQGQKVLFGTMMARGAGLDLLNVGDDRV